MSHNLGLDAAPDADRHFDDRDQGWTKVVLDPVSGWPGGRRLIRAGGPMPYGRRCG